MRNMLPYQGFNPFYSSLFWLQIIPNRFSHPKYFETHKTCVIKQCVFLIQNIQNLLGCEIFADASILWLTWAFLWNQCFSLLYLRPLFVIFWNIKPQSVNKMSLKTSIEMSSVWIVWLFAMLTWEVAMAIRMTVKFVGSD